MKIYGSLTNRFEETANSPTPFVGMYATEYCWSDTHAYEVVAVKDEKHVQVRRLIAKRIDKNGMSESQDYKYESDPDGYILNLTKYKSGGWHERYPDGHKGCNTFVLGHAREYYDYSF